MIKKTFLVIFIIPLSLSFAQQYWIQKPSPATNSLTRIQFVDTLYGWASGDSGTVIHTTNSGQNWVIQNTGFQGAIEDIYFLNRDYGWAVGNDIYFTGTKILKTSNGGLNWQLSAYPDTSIVFNSIHFLNLTSGFLTGYTGQIHKTTNGGTNWYACRFDTNSCFIYLFPKFNITFFNAQVGFACGGVMDLQGIVWKTTDSGLNWFTYCIAPEPLKRIKPLSSSKIMSTGGDYEYGCSVIQSLDSGKSWKYDTTRLIGIGTALAFRTPSELWVPLSIDTAWGLSLDSGGYQKPWYKIYTPNGTFIYDAQFVTPAFGWACGKNGVLLKYNSDIIGISQYGNQLPDKSLLFQNYPNPFNPSTTIGYYLPKKSFVKIIIYDLLGKEVQKFTEGTRLPGIHKFRFFAPNLASGIYIYKIEALTLELKAELFTETKKMVLLK